MNSEEMTKDEAEQVQAEELSSELEDSQLDEVAGGVVTNSMENSKDDTRPKRRGGTQDI